MPAFWLYAKRLPLGALRSISSVTGTRPCGPGGFVWRSKIAGFPESRMLSNVMRALLFFLSFNGCTPCLRPQDVQSVASTYQNPLTLSVGRVILPALRTDIHSDADRAITKLLTNSNALLCGRLW